MRELALQSGTRSDVVDSGIAGEQQRLCNRAEGELQ
jgi:hypothetical protein